MHVGTSCMGLLSEQVVDLERDNPPYFSVFVHFKHSSMQYRLMVKTFLRNNHAILYSSMSRQHGTIWEPGFCPKELPRVIATRKMGDGESNPNYDGSPLLSEYLQA